MKIKTKLFGACLLGTFAMTAVLLSGNKPLTQAKASQQAHTVINDGFNKKFKSTIGPTSGTYNPVESIGSRDVSDWKVDHDIWTEGEGNEIGQSKDAQTYLSNAGGSRNAESYTFSTAKKYTGISKVSFDYFFSTAAYNSNPVKWFSLYMVDEQNDYYKEYDDGGGTTYSLVYAGLGRVVATGLTSSSYGATDSLGISKTSNNSWVHCELTINSATNFTYSLSNVGEAIDHSFDKTSNYYVPGIDLQNAYFGLTCSNEEGELRFDNFRIEHADGVLEEDFSEFDEIGIDTPIFNMVYNPLNGGENNDYKYSIVNNSYCEFDNAKVGDFIYSNDEVIDGAPEVKDIDIIDMNFDAKITSGYKLGFYFGYRPEMTNFDDCFKLEITGTTGKVYCKYMDGEEEKNKTVSFTLTDLKNESNIRLVINKETGLKIYQNNNVVKNGTSNIIWPKNLVENFFGRLVITLVQKGSGVCYIDNIVVRNDKFFKPVSKSVSHDFSLEYWGNEDSPDFVLDNVNHFGSAVKDGKLFFNKASDDTFFASAHQYDNFIMDFKLCNIYGGSTKSGVDGMTNKNCWIGIDLSRKRAAASKYGSYATLITNITPDVASNPSQWRQGCYTDTNVSPITSFDVKVKKYDDIPTSLFEALYYETENQKDTISPLDAVCFRYVAEDGNISLYLKKESDQRFTKYYTYSNLELNGYFALVCTGFLYCEIDDFSMTNTSDVYTNAPVYIPEPITVTNTEVIYDNYNATVDFTTEQELNLGGKGGLFGGCKGSVVASSIIVFSTTLSGLGFVIAKKRKERD